MTSPLDSRPSISLVRLVRLAQKELREILRDRRTILTLVLMPLLLYPLLSLGFQRFLLTSLGPQVTSEWRLGFVSARDQELFAHLLEMGREETPRQPTAADAAGALKPEPAGPPRMFAKIVSDEAQLKAALEQFDLDVGLILRRPSEAGAAVPSISEPAALDWDIIYVEGSAVGEEARAALERRLRTAGHAWLRARLRALQVAQRPEPFRVQRQPLVSTATSPAMTLAALVPVILILMTMTGAVYPAIDLTAGERERGTLEMLVAAPIPRLGLLFAKYVAVVTVAFLTAAVNLLSMAITIYAGGLTTMLFGEEGVSLTTMLQIFGLMLLFACFFSGVLLTLTSFARSFKEAQAYLIPLMVFSLSPGLIGLFPDLQLAGWLQVAPLLNIVLLSRDLLKETASAGPAAVVIVSTLLYAAAAVSVAARVFGGEAVLYDSPGNWSDLFRRASHPRPAAKISSALLCLALMFPALFVGNSVLAQLKDASLTGKLLSAAVMTAAIFALFPLVAAWLANVPYSSGLRFRAPPWLSLPAALLLGVSLWPFAHEIVVFAREAGFASLSDDQLERARGLLTGLQAVSPLVILFSLAIVPGICEELFFRGYLFSAFAARWKPWPAILISGVLFGLFHLVATDALSLERLLPSTMLGIILGWVCWRTGSVCPGMLLHVTHNGLLVMSARFQRELSAWGWSFDRAADLDQAHLPASWLITAAITASVGALLMMAVRRHEPEASATVGSVNVGAIND